MLKVPNDLLLGALQVLFAGDNGGSPRRDSTEVPSNLVSPSTDKKPFADLRRDFGSTDWETKPSSVPYLRNLFT